MVPLPREYTAKSRVGNPLFGLPAHVFEPRDDYGVKKRYPSEYRCVETEPEEH
jgi:hypothetical protein